MATMATTTDDVFPKKDLLDVLLAAGPMTLHEMAAQLGISDRTAWVRARLAVQDGYLDRDEFGRYAAWCAWPRTGL